MGLAHTRFLKPKWVDDRWMKWGKKGKEEGENHNIPLRGWGKVHRDLVLLEDFVVR